MQEKTLKYTLTKVEVFQYSAMLTMEGQIELEKGEHKLLFDNLPRNMDKDSVRVKGVGEGQIVNIEIDEKYSKTSFDEELAALNKEYETEKQMETILRRQLENLQMRKNKTVEAMSNFAVEYPKFYSLGKIGLAEIESLSNVLKNNLDEITKEILATEAKLEEVMRSIQEIQQKISKKNQEEHDLLKKYYRVSVTLDAKGKCVFKLLVKFIISGAYWVPMYDIVITDEDIELKLIANVFNQTEIDWTDVNLVISTASIEAVRIIKPEPFYIKERVNYYPNKKLSPSRPMAMAKGRSGGGMMKMDMQVQQMANNYDFQQEIAMEPMVAEPQVDASANLGVQSYNIPAKVSIACDFNNPKPINLINKKINSTKQYFWSVKSPAQVLCYDKAKNEDLLLLPGVAKVYFNEEFIGQTELDLIAPHQEFDIGERVSYAISVDKKLKNKNIDKQGALKGKKVVNYTYEIEIKNLAKVTDTLELWDRIPHSSSEKIKVKINSISDEPKEKDLGVLQWNLSLSDVKEKKVISYSYEVQAEKDVYIDPPLP